MAKTKYVKVKNTSRGYFFLDLTMAGGKVIEMKADTIAAITEDEYEYLSNSCPRVFEDGDLVVIDKDKNEENNPNVATNTDIDEIVEMNLPELKKKLKEITSTTLLKDIRLKATDEGKTKKFMEAIDNRISELSDGSVLI